MTNQSTAQKKTGPECEHPACHKNRAIVLVLDVEVVFDWLTAILCNKDYISLKTIRVPIQDIVKDYIIVKLNGIVIHNNKVRIALIISPDECIDRDKEWVYRGATFFEYVKDLDFSNNLLSTNKNVAIVSSIEPYVKVKVSDHQGITLDENALIQP